MSRNLFVPNFEQWPIVNVFQSLRKIEVFNSSNFFPSLFDEQGGRASFPRKRKPHWLEKLPCWAHLASLSATWCSSPSSALTSSNVARSGKPWAGRTSSKRRGNSRTTILDESGATALWGDTTTSSSRGLWPSPRPRAQFRFEISRFSWRTWSLFSRMFRRRMSWTATRPTSGMTSGLARLVYSNFFFLLFEKFFLQCCIKMFICPFLVWVWFFDCFTAKIGIFPSKLEVFLILDA